MSSTATMGTEAELVAHHFENLEQQRDVNSLGMWLFLASEILFFGGIFAAYAVMRYGMSGGQEGFSLGSSRLNPLLGGLNTAVLLTSSLTMALAVWAAQTGQRKALQLFLALTLLFGTAFLVVKGFEWTHEYHEGLLPGSRFGITSEGERIKYKVGDGLRGRTGEEIPLGKAKQMQMFFVFYFIITGLHALHMIIGLGALGIQLVLALRSNFGIADWGPIEVSGLYWHFVDVVWIFVFPLLYLLRN